MIIPNDATKEKLAQEFDGVVDQAEHLIKSVANAGREQAAGIKASVDDNFAAASERLVRIRTDAIEQAGSAARATDQYVQVNPWRAVGIAAAVAGIAGLLAGALLARR
jgi:ElaB/YqjD/DUF883 family membrane-anchored ribosome-binding protein